MKSYRYWQCAACCTHNDSQAAVKKVNNYDKNNASINACRFGNRQTTADMKTNWFKS